MRGILTTFALSALAKLSQKAAGIFAFPTPDCQVVLKPSTLTMAPRMKVIFVLCSAADAGPMKLVSGVLF